MVCNPGWFLLNPSDIDVVGDWHCDAESLRENHLAVISENTSTTFTFQLPSEFPPFRRHQTGFFEREPIRVTTCGLFFHLPFCSDLPYGYPCYDWTGMVQQTLSDSSMT